MTKPQTLTAALVTACSTHAESVCLETADGKAWTYGDIDALAQRMATVLLDQGVVVGDRVLAQIDKSVAAVALYLACLRVGAAYVPLNTAYTAGELDYFVADAQPALCVCRQQDEAEFGARLESVPVLSLSADHKGSLMRAAGEAEPTAAVAAVQPTSVAAILYTSGTTGRSKGAMLTQHNLLSNALTLVDLWGWQADDVLLHALPIFHVHGLFVALHCQQQGLEHTLSGMPAGNDPSGALYGGR